MQQPTAGRLVMGYYAATLLFLFLDFGLSVNVRLAFLESAPAWKGAYYAFCMACAGVMYWRPDLRLIIGAVEGLMTMVGLIFSMYLGYTLAGVSGFGEVLQVLLNYAISGFFAYLSWARGLSALAAR
ncbi:MAG: hypothetical protein QNJ40_04255 [Xanthomonadales bacterium]|nr:hypothetical protein [Xanthomonadales bacterium]